MFGIFSALAGLSYLHDIDPAHKLSFSLQSAVKGAADDKTGLAAEQMCKLHISTISNNIRENH